MKLKELERPAVRVWSPASQYPVSGATGCSTTSQATGRSSVITDALGTCPCQPLPGFQHAHCRC